MKKIICLSLVILSMAASAFAGNMSSNDVTTSAAAVRGGADNTAAAAAPTPLIQLSTGVSALVNWSFDAADKTSTGYIIATRHTTGSKNFATSNALPNVYWKQAPKIQGTVTVSSAMKADVGTSTVADTVFAAGNGWTSY